MPEVQTSQLVVRSDLRARNVGSSTRVLVKKAVKAPPKRLEIPKGIPSGRVAPRFESALTRLAEHARLPQNWDTYDAPPPDKDAVSHAYRVLLAMSAAATGPATTPPTVVPVSDGSIGIEWVAGRRELHVYSMADGTFEILKSAGDQDTESTGTLDDVRAAIRWFVERE